MYSTQTFIPPTQENENQKAAFKKKSKRTRNPDNWKKEKRKKAILSGQAYLNTKGELVGPRFIGPDCNCKHRCFVNVSDENRLGIFNGYYSLKSYDEQNAYLYGLIRRYEIQRKRKPVSERRTCSYKYFVRVKGREVQVCKKAFANIHGISDKKIRTLCIKHEKNILFPRDNRGRHNNRPKKVTPELVTLIKHHILRKLVGPNVGDFIKTEKNQGPDVNISKLHKNFLQEYQPEAIDKESEKVIKDFDVKVKSWLYFKIFHEEFNSMDFNTVKRKLSDLRKSLEGPGTTISDKKKGKQAKGKGGKNDKSEKDQHHQQQQQQHQLQQQQQQQQIIMSQGHLNQAISMQHCSVNSLNPCQIGYVGRGIQQQPSFPHNLQLRMLSLQHLNGNPCSTNAFPPQPISQQPLNLQTGVSNIAAVPSSDQVQTASNHPSQPFSLNLHSVGAAPMSSYYLCFGHVSNLIPLPVSSSNVITPVSPTMHPSQNEQHSSSTTFQQQQPIHQQYPNSHSIPQPQHVSTIASQSDLVNSHSHPNVIQGYHGNHSTNMY